MVVPDLLDDVGEVGQVDLLGEGSVGSLRRYDDIVDHVADLHGQLVGLVEVRGGGRVGGAHLPPLLPLLVPLLLVLHPEFKI